MSKPIQEHDEQRCAQKLYALAVVKGAAASAVHNAARLFNEKVREAEGVGLTVTFEDKSIRVEHGRTTESELRASVVETIEYGRAAK